MGFLDRDDAALATPYYIQYRAEAAAAGKEVLCLHLWQLWSLLGPVEGCDGEPPAKRTCTAGVASEHMEESVL